jgi:ribosome-binding factor A
VKGQHQVRTRDRILRILTTALREDVRDPAIGFVTLTDVRLAPDLSQATVFVTSLEESSAARKKILDGLVRAAPFLRRQLAQRGNLRRTPQLRFEFDRVAESGARLEKLFSEMREERGDEPEDA